MTTEPSSVHAAVALLSAVAHPVRLSTLLALADGGERCAGELQELAGIEQSAMSHQLRVLRENRLVVTERRGRHVWYRVADEHVANLVRDAVAHARHT